MGGATILLVNFPSTTDPKLNFLIFGELDFRLFPIAGPQRYPVGGAVLVTLIPMVILVPLLSLEAGVEFFLILL